MKGVLITKPELVERLQAYSSSLSPRSSASAVAENFISIMLEIVEADAARRCLINSIIDAFRKNSFQIRVRKNSDGDDVRTLTMVL